MSRSDSPGARGGLGRGLDALIPRGSSLQEIPVARIHPNPGQPRQQFDQAALEELAASIREHGVIQPVIVTRQGSDYTLVAGERRWRAAQLAQIQALPAIVKEASSRSALELALVENLQRMDLTALEEAAAYRELTESHGMSHEEVATRVGRSRVVITNRLRLLALPDGTRALLAEGRLTEGHARALLGCANPAMIDTLAHRVADQGLNVRQTEELIRRLTEPRETVHPEDPLASEVEESLQRRLGTRVQIQQSRKGGRLVIHYYDGDQLQGLIDLLLGQETQ